MSQLVATSQVDREYLVRRSMLKGYQFGSLIAPPLYTALVLARRRGGALPWSLNRMLRATWIGGVAGKPFSVLAAIVAIPHGNASGVAQGGALEFLRTSYEDNFRLRTRHISAMYNVSCFSCMLQDTPKRLYTCFPQRSSIRADDHSTIGAILGALLTPAIFWKRARSIHRKFTADIVSIDGLLSSRDAVFLGGAGIGAGAGLAAHWVRSVTGDRPPEAIPPIAPAPPTPSS